MKLLKTICALACLLGLAEPLQAQTKGELACNANLPESTPNADFIDHGDGTVTHNRTGLMWKRCAEGQTWSAGTCIGNAGSNNWPGALLYARDTNFANHTDWRLPNVKELQSIVEYKCDSPSINASIFPNTSASHFVSASTSTNNSQQVWSVHFGYGTVGSGNMSFFYKFRLVRAGQSFGSFDVLNTAPVCTLVPAPPSVRKNGSARLTASCIPMVTSYNWTGDSCAAVHTETCDVTPAATTSYSVSGTNSIGASPVATATVTVKSADLTPILMLLLD